MTISDIEDIRTIIERDIEWRLNEISFLSNLINKIDGTDKESKKDIYRKTLVLSLYAHFEGYFKYAFEIYAHALNELNLEIEKVQSVLKISALNNTFSKYDEQNKWIEGTFLYEKSNRRFINRTLLIENLETERYKKLVLPISSRADDKNSIVYTESNLTPAVIDKILYRLGIHPKLGVNSEEFWRLMGIVSQFVKKRNGIAHGDNKSEFKDGLSEREYNTFKALFDRIINLIAPIITKSLSEKSYLKIEYRG